MQFYRDMPKTNVVSFRLDDKKFAALRKIIDTDQPVLVKSENQLARKIVEDMLAGRLVYLEEGDRDQDLGSLEAKS